MKVLYDGIIYSLQATGGINRYFSNIISRLPDDFTPLLTTPASGKITLPVHPKLRTYSYKEFRFRPGRIANQLNKHYVRTIPVTDCPHIIHPTYYKMLSGHDMSAYRRPVVITVWDMIHELFPGLIDPYGKEAHHKKNAITAAQAVLCISENTKKDLIERFPMAENKVFVTPLASEIDEGLSYGVEKTPDRPYFLYVGSRYAYKNFDGLLKAFAKTASANPDVVLLVVGPPFDEEEKRMISDLKIENRIEHYGSVSDRHLAKLYRLSTAFVYPSLYEGFGIPLLEAMACGTPVIASRRSSFPEVVGDAGLLFDPGSDDELRDMLLWLLEDPSERERIIAKGHERVKIFSWDKTAAQTVEVYKSLI